jgi:hypothetical protein
MAWIRLRPLPAGGRTEPSRAGGYGDVVVAEASTWLVRLARVGYAAKGVLHLVIGGLATLAAIGSGGGTTDSRGALGIIGGTSMGRGLLITMGVGLLAYALWALVAAWVDVERRGADAKGIALRIGLAARGFIYGALGVEAVRLFITARASDGNGAEHWTARVLAMPAGQWLVAGAGAAVIGYALYQGWRAAHTDLRRRVRLAETGAAGPWVIRFARFGIAARGVVFLVIGWFLVQAALRQDPHRAGGIDESLRALQAQAHGPVLLAVVALGLVAFGIWQLVRARYREMEMQ